MITRAELDLELRRLERERTIVDECVKALCHSGWELRGVERRDLSRAVGDAESRLCRARSTLDDQIQVAEMRRRRLLTVEAKR